MEIKEFIGEIWRPVKGYEGLYEVSNFGRIKSLPRNGTIKTEKLLSQGKCGKYYNVRLYKNNVAKTYFVHRIEMIAFVPNPSNLPEVNHKNENTFDNNLSNLEWCDRLYNANYGTGKQRQAEAQGKPVLQYDRNGVCLQRFVSISEAQRQTKSWGISAKCRGERKQSGRYIWRFEKEADD